MAQLDRYKLLVVRMALGCITDVERVEMAELEKALKAVIEADESTTLINKCGE